MPSVCLQFMHLSLEPKAEEFGRSKLELQPQRPPTKLTERSEARHAEAVFRLERRARRAEVVRWQPLAVVLAVATPRRHLYPTARL